jgi:hypothetical protein
MTSSPPASTSGADGPPRPARARRAGLLIAVALATAAGVWAVVGSAWVLPQLSANSDEGLYLLQAETLASGRLAPEAPEVDAASYRPWFSTEREGRYVLKYTPVHASVLAAADVATGSHRPALSAIAAAQVALVIVLARELGAGGRAALLAGALFALAPLVLQLNITYLSYGTSLALLLAAAIGAARAWRTGSRWVAVGAGFCWGLAAFARPYDAALMGVAMAAAGVVVERRRTGQWQRLAPLAGLAALGALGPLLALLAFNQAMTGDPLDLPFRILEPRDGPGLGLRRSLPTDGYVDYTLDRAASSLARNLLLVSAWGAGGLLGACLAVATLVRRRLRGGPLVIAVLVVWSVGYALFWGSYVAAFLWDGALFLGPFYYLPMVAMLAIPAGVALDDLWRWRAPVAAVAVLGAGALTLAVVVPRLAEQHDRSQPRSELADVVEREVDGPALVFVPSVYGPFLQNPLSFLRNQPGLDGRVLYAVDRGAAANSRVQAAHPERRAYRLVLPVGWNDQPGFHPQARVEVLPQLSAARKHAWEGDERRR